MFLETDSRFVLSCLMKVPKVQPPYRTSEPRINSSSKHHSPNRVRARAAKRDNFVVAVFNINENVSPAFPVDSASPSEETAVTLHRKSSLPQKSSCEAVLKNRN
jgi:hypothetical protein